jgi:hypothetical protein
MMNIRFGTYTVIDGIEMRINGMRTEVPIRPSDKMYLISYSATLEKIDGFALYQLPPPYTAEWRKEIRFSELQNAFLIVTKAVFGGGVFTVEPFLNEDNILHLATQDLILGKRHGFYEMHDGQGRSYYLGEVNCKELDKLWEEYSPSSLNLPMPEGLPKERVIEIPKRDL